MHGHSTRIATGVGLNLGVVKLDLTRTGTRERSDPGATLHALLDVLVLAASEAPTVVVLDEFSGIARVDGAAGLAASARRRWRVTCEATSHRSFAIPYAAT